jgi:hypothetical protein
MLSIINNKVIHFSRLFNIANGNELFNINKINRCEMIFGDQINRNNAYKYNGFRLK